MLMPTVMWYTVSKGFQMQTEKIYLVSAVAPNNLPICFSSFAHISAP